MTSTYADNHKAQEIKRDCVNAIGELIKIEHPIEIGFVEIFRALFEITRIKNEMFKQVIFSTHQTLNECIKTFNSNFHCARTPNTLDDYILAVGFEAIQIIRRRSGKDNK